MLAAAVIAVGAASGCGVLAAEAPALELEVRSAAGDVNAFEPGTLLAPPNTLVAVDFANVSVREHNMVFIDPIAARTRDIVEPGDRDTFQFKTPSAGTYRFVCTVHEEMTGQLIVR